MKNTRWKQSFAKAAMLFGLAGSLLMPLSVQATETEESMQEAVTTQVSKNVTKKITKKNTDITMDVVCGIDGVAVYDNPMLIQVTVKSSKDFNGYIKVAPERNYGEKIVAYGEDISIAAGTAKTFSFVVGNQNNEGRFSVALLDEKDKVVYSESDSVYLEGMGNSVYMGVMSDDFSSMAYFDAASVDYAGYEQQVNLLELSKDNFPEDSDAIGMMAYLLIDNYDTAQLSDRQYTALKDWVKEGGVLLVALGANYQNVLHRFDDDFLSGTLGTVSKKNVSWNIETEKITLNAVDSMEFSLDGGEPLDSFAEDGTVYKKEIGSGMVVVLPYDLGMEPFVSFDKRKEVVTKLLKESTGAQTISRMAGNTSSYYYYYNSSDIATVMNDSKKPSALLFGFILIAYVVFVGPVLYLILKKYNKREKIWIAIPITAAACTVVIFLFSTIYRVRKPMINSFSVIQLGEGSKEEKVYTNIICPKAKDYSLMLEEGYGNVMAQINYSYNIFSGYEKDEEGSYDMMVKKKNDGIELCLHNSEAFQEKNFTMSCTSPNDLGSIDLDIHCYTKGFGGTVTNHMNCDLSNVVVNFEDHFYMIDSLKKGESAKIDESKLIEAQTYDSFSDVMGLNNLVFTKIARETDLKKYRHLEMNRFMENYYVKKDIYQQGCVWADIGSYTPKLTKEGSVKQYGGGVVYVPFSGEYEDVSSSYCPDIDTVMIASDGDFDPIEKYIYSGIVTATYSFEDYPDITTLENLDYNQTGNGVTYSSVYAYNADTGNYDSIFTDSAVLTGEEFKKYVVGNVLLLRFESGSNDVAYMPRISARGDE
ncbi:MAG: hypothetical protein K2L07_10465 [Lachnospiraceae bacterium]|nr:hypothetical protein [Lachnospiraceae bacterium]